jgi:hypothetical protein
MSTILVLASGSYHPLTDVRPVILDIRDASRRLPYGCRAADIPLTESMVKGKVAALPCLA